jgi:putative Holliday junction resolvase
MKDSWREHKVKQNDHNSGRFVFRAILPHMKRMGIDYGSKKIGIALTDDSGSMAFPHEVVPNNDDFLSYIEALVEERGVCEIVIGHSLNNQGEPNAIHQAVEEFMTDITLSIGIPVHLEPEQYSTQQAKQIQGKSDLTDASAAAIILDSFITKQNN